MTAKNTPKIIIKEVIFSLHAAAEQELFPLSEAHTIPSPLPATQAAVTSERSRARRSRADLPQPVELEKDFTELMMSDTSASVSEPSQWVRHVAPLPGEGTEQGLGDSDTNPGSPHCCRQSCPTTASLPSAQQPPAGNTLCRGHYKISSCEGCKCPLNRRTRLNGQHL